jgi:hypothetical protein
LVEKPQLIETLTWDPTMAAGSIIAAYDSPFGLIRSRVMKSAFTRYCYANMDTHIELRITGSPFLCGSVAIIWAPYMSITEATLTYQNNPKSWTVARHAVLYAGENEGVSLDVPFLMPRSHLDLRSNNTSNSIGCFLVMVLNPIQFGAGAINTTISLSVWANFSRSDFAVINPTGTSIVPQGGIVSGMRKLNNVSNAVLDGVDHATGAIDEFAGSLDYPNSALNPPPMQPRPFSDVANTQQVSYSPVLGENGMGASLVTASVTTSSDDEMDIRQNTQRLAYWSTFSVSTVDAVGTSVFVGDLGPCADLFLLPVGTKFTPHALTYFSLPFSYWRGGLKWRFKAVCTRYHRARLQICSHVGFEASGLTVDESFGQYSVTWDLSGTSDITIVFPFRSTTEWKKVNNGSPASARDYTMGQFSVRVLNPPIGIDGVSNSFQINAYLCGDHDYELCHLGYNSIDFIPQDIAPTLSVEDRMKGRTQRVCSTKIRVR